MSNENDNQPKIEIEEENDEILNEDENNQDSDYLMEEKITSYSDFYKNMIKDSENRKSIPFLTKFEKSRIIGIRAQQLSQNMPALVDISDCTTPVEIALKELKEGKLPFIIRREMPNGSYEDWRVDELKIDSF
jgi:DNA-directed RNA polymerase I, II, and III subunit RPABC2